jgi:hypothetical protein
MAKATASLKTREQCVQFAKLAEQVEQYDGRFSHRSVCHHGGAATRFSALGGALATQMYTLYTLISVKNVNTLS